RVAVRLEQLQQAPDETRVVLRVGVDRSFAVTVPAQQPPIRIAPEMFADEQGGPVRGLAAPDRLGAAERARGPRERGDHHAVPRRDDLVVEMRPLTPAP